MLVSRFIKRQLTSLKTLHLWANNRDLLGKYYDLVCPDYVRTRKISDTIFIFGSGRSILELTSQEIEVFRNANTLSFNWFIKQSLFPVDFHLTRRIGDPDNGDGDNDSLKALAGVKKFFDQYRMNPFYRDTVLLLQWERRAIGSQLAVSNQLIPSGTRVFPWQTKPGVRLSDRIEDGLTHGHSVLCECINWAYLFGWKSIVLVGVDLYDNGYFWMAPGESTRFQTERGNRWGMHSTAVSGIVEFLANWNDELEKDGVTLFAYNPRSMLRKSLPQYPRVCASF
jgi:hypothetical protein